MRLAVVIASRGLVFSETVDEVLREAMASGCEWRIFWAHSRPIPDCFNEPTTAALEWGAEQVWFVEEDMVIPAGILDELRAAGQPVAASDYPVNAAGDSCVMRDRDGLAMWAGTGCLLIDAATLAELMPFSTSHQYVRIGNEWHRAPAEPDATAYGMHDIDFGMHLYSRGTPIHIIRTTCNQRVVVREAAHKRNQNGWHQIGLLAGQPKEIRTS